MTGCTAASGRTTRPCSSCWPIIAHWHDTIIDQNIVDLLNVEVDVVVVVLMLVVAVRAHVGPHGIASRCATSLFITSHASVRSSLCTTAVIIFQNIFCTFKISRPTSWTCSTLILMTPRGMMVTLSIVPVGRGLGLRVLGEALLALLSQDVCL